MSLKRILLITAGGTIAGHIIGRLLGKTEEEKQRYSRNGRFAGGLGGFIIAAATEKPQDTVNYKLLRNKKRVYDGITYEDRLDVRIWEHEMDGKLFDEVIYGEATTRCSALEIERKRIKRHKGIYNVQHNS